MFIKVAENTVINSDRIDHIDCSKLESNVTVTVWYRRGDQLEIAVPSGQMAVDLIMRLCPYVIEGKRMKFIRNSWSLHNLIAHPVMQIFAWIKLTKLGLMIHDNTVPQPKR